jgi:nucleotide-binding universal stress UspA family protein
VAAEGITVDTHVHPNPERDVARGLVDHAVELGCDLIVMATHGSGGIRDVVTGNIAQQVLARGEVPVLLFRPDCAPGGAPFGIARALVPLDGTPDAEKCLPQAAELARSWNARLLLLRVVPTARDLSGDQAALAALLPSATRATLEIEESAAVDYLRAKRAELAGNGVRVDVLLRRGDPKVVVPEETQRLGADVVVMATHGRAGLDAFWAGSIGSRVVERLCTPVLIVRSNR